MLEPDGVAVEEASDGQQALAAVTQAPPRLLILDLMLPHTDGWAVARQLRYQQDWIRGHHPADRARRPGRDVAGLAGRVDSSVTKPFEPDVLLAEVTAC